MSRVYVCLLGITALLLSACSSPAPKPAPKPTPASQPEAAKKVEKAKPAAPLPVPREVAAERTRQFIGELAAGRYAKAFEMMTDRMKKVMPAAKMEKLWLILQSKLGFFEGLGKMRFKVKGPSHMVRVVARYEDIPMDFVVSVNPKIQVEGFFIKHIDLPRPQTPKPPMPYTQREVSYKNPADGTSLGGTLTIPKPLSILTAAKPSDKAKKKPADKAKKKPASKKAGEWRHPAVLLITGSGPQDRDETVFGHKPFLVLADRLTRAGFVVLRVDDRGVGKSTGSAKQSTLEDFASDVAAGVAFLKTQPEVNPKKVGLLGHSEGAIVGAMVAAVRKHGVAFLVSIAGPGVKGTALSAMQMKLLLKADGKIPLPEIKKLVALQVKAQALLLKKGDKAKIAKLLDQASAIGIKYVAKKHRKLATPAMQAAMTQSQLATMASPWFASFLRTDPIRYWRKVRCPVLHLIGGKDLQVPADANIKPVVRALRRARNKDVTAKKLPGLNHLFQKAKTGLLKEYAELDETFNVEALDMIESWMKKRFVR